MTAPAFFNICIDGKQSIRIVVTREWRMNYRHRQVHFIISESSKTLRHACNTPPTAEREEKCCVIMRIVNKNYGHALSKNYGNALFEKNYALYFFFQKTAFLC